MKPAPRFTRRGLFDTKKAHLEFVRNLFLCYNSASMAPSSRSSRRRYHDRRLTERERSREPRPPHLKPETWRGIAIVILLVTAAITGLSVAGQAGGMGNAIAQGLGILFGAQRYLVPLYFAAVGIVLLFPERFVVSAARWVGLTLAVISAAGLLQMAQPLGSFSQAAANGRGGGFLGVMLDNPLRSAFGALAAGIIMAGLLLVGLLVLFNTTPHGIVGQGNIFSRFFSSIRGWMWRRRLATDDQAGPAADDEAAFTARDMNEGEEEVNEEQAPAPEDDDEETAIAAPVKPVKRPRRNIAIPIDLLDGTTSQPTSGNIDDKKEKIRKTLENFGISVEMDDVNIGPTVTQFTLKPAEGVRLNQITALNNDLALALAAHPIRIEAPIPGKSLVGIEVPNESVATVRLREILSSGVFKERKSNLTFSLGKDVSGQPWTADLDPLPHLLIAGATGSGKSVMVNGLIVSLLYSNSPDDLKFILVDPKRVELSMYNGIPHLLTPVINDTTKTINALRWVVSEMDRRYSVLQNAGKRNIGSYRQAGGDLPYIVVVIDELADLMSVAANEVEGAIVRLAQMARAVGIHLVLATQRPSVDVITGLIKANVTARAAFTVASQVDSRTILDMSGAEKLLGKGDMLFISADLSKPKRIQGAFVSEQEVERVAQFLRARSGEPDYQQEIVEKTQPMIGGSLEDLGEDELLAQAKEAILQAGKASASYLQRRLRIGYARAARLLDLLEEQGFIGPGEGAKPREVYGAIPSGSDMTADLKAEENIPLADSEAEETGDSDEPSEEEPADDDKPLA